MKKLISIALSLFALTAYAQDDLSKRALPIVEEGKRLYRLETTSWNGTDAFVAAYKDVASIGGYFSYEEEGIAKCIFISKAEVPRVIGTVSFDSTLDIRTVKTDLSERDLTPHELDIYTIRKLALESFNSDAVFKRYKNTNLNPIPIVNKRERKVYILTATRENGVVIFGNDYLFVFNKNNRLTSKEQLHKSLMATRYDEKQEGENSVLGPLHTHLPEMSDFMTATDICTLLLYGKFTGWKQYSVVSKKYLNVWSVESGELTVVPLDLLDKEKGNKKKRK